MTISMVVPTVLDLYSHLGNMREKARHGHCKALVNKLMTSLMRRFKGIFVACSMAASEAAHEEPFSDKVYLIAAVLDPRFAMHWVDIDVLTEGDATTLKQLRQDVKDMLEGISE